MDGKQGMFPKAFVRIMIDVDGTVAIKSQNSSQPVSRNTSLQVYIYMRVCTCMTMYILILSVYISLSMCICMRV